MLSRSSLPKLSKVHKVVRHFSLFSVQGTSAMHTHSVFGNQMRRLLPLSLVIVGLLLQPLLPLDLLPHVQAQSEGQGKLVQEGPQTKLEGVGEVSQKKLLGPNSLLEEEGKQVKLTRTAVVLEEEGNSRVLAKLEVLGLQSLPEVWPVGETLYLSAGKSKFGSKPGSVKWIIKPDIRSRRSIPFTDPVLGPILPLSPGGKPINITVTLVVTLDDEIDFFEHEISFTDGGVEPDPLPNPNPKPIPPGPKPSWPEIPLSCRADVAAAFADADKATSLEELQILTTNGITKRIGVQRFLDEYIPWRDQFGKIVNDMKLTTLQQYKDIWKVVASSK